MTLEPQNTLFTCKRKVRTGPDVVANAILFDTLRRMIAAPKPLLWSSLEEDLSAWGTDVMRLMMRTLVGNCALFRVESGVVELLGNANDRFAAYLGDKEVMELVHDRGGIGPTVEAAALLQTQYECCHRLVSGLDPMPEVGERIFVDSAEGMFEGTVTGHDFKDGMPVLAYDCDQQTGTGKTIKAPKRAWLTQVRATEGLAQQEYDRLRAQARDACARRISGSTSINAADSAQRDLKYALNRIDAMSSEDLARSASKRLH